MARFGANRSKTESKTKSKRVKSSGRKEIVFLCTTLAVIVGVFVISRVVPDEEHYNRDNVTLDFSQDVQPYVKNEVGDSLEMGDFTGSTPDEEYEPPEGSVAFNPDQGASSSDSSDEIKLDVEWIIDDDGNYVSSYGAVISPESGAVGPNGETIGEDGVVRGPAGEDLGFVPGKKPARPSAEQYVTMLVHYICGVEDSMFESYMSKSLQESFGIRTDSPYVELSGKTSFKLGKMDENSFSFTVDSKFYTFEVYFEGDVVSSLEYKQ